MSYNGSGTFTINTTGQPVVAGTVITASAFNALTTDLATGLTTAITKDGQTTTTARIIFAQGTRDSTLTASSAVATDASKNLVSVTNTGTGNNVLATSPTLVTPALGTPSALVLTNATGLPQTGLATNVVGNGPAFSAYQSSAQTLVTSTSTKITFDVEEFDTNSNFASSRFTPTVAGYYKFCTAIQMGVQASIIILTLFKNGSAEKAVGQTSTSFLSLISGSALIYCNGSTDYVEVYAQLGIGQALSASSSQTYFQGVMVRSA